MSSPAPRQATGPIGRAANAAQGTCRDNLNGTLTISTEWLCNYSRLLLQQACDARLRSLGIPVDGESTREAIEEFLKLKASPL